MMKNRKISIKTEYVLVFLTIYLSMDSLLFGTNANSYASAILVGLTGIIAVLLFFRRWKRKGHIDLSENEFKKVFSLLFILLLSHIIALSLGNNGIEVQYIYNYLIIIYMFELSKIISANAFFESYINVMTVIACVAVLLFSLDSAGLLVRIPSIIITNISGYRYRFFGLGAMMEHMQYYIVRAYGIFREPGVFSVYLCIAIGMMFFFSK